MDHIDQAFRALSRRIGSLPMPDDRRPKPESLANIIAKVNRAKGRYDPGLPRPGR